MHERLKERNLAIVRLYCENNTLKEVGDAFGLTSERVRIILNKQGIATKHKPNPAKVKIKRPKLTSREKFWSKVDRLDDETACWFWKKQNGKNPYGKMRFNGKAWYSHHLAWLFAHGKKSDKWILHDCGNSYCCNPNHLKEGDAKQKAMDLKRHTEEKGLYIRRK